MPLSRELLERLERAWVDQGCPWVETLRPGPTEEQLAETLAPFGYPISDELSCWWTWRSGDPRTGWITDGLEWISPAVAVRASRLNREVADDVAGGDRGHAEWIWPHAWLPLFGTGGSTEYCADCSVPVRAGPVFHHSFHDSTDDGLYVAASSLGDLVHQLCEAYDAGLQRWDKIAGRWVRKYPKPRLCIPL